ncbi:MAG: cob(I)yrinic acid a,c-diamide adenosyltransferase [Candidatus Micrarchaeota archaeon]
MPIYTKTGDLGQTSLLGGERVSKSDARVSACGDTDELNACIGVILSFSEDKQIAEQLQEIQKDLFTIGAHLASKKAAVPLPILPLHRISQMEEHMDKIEEELGPLRNFILPGGSKTGALLHLARAICRRAERNIIVLNELEKVNENIVIYLNRLSDYLFMLARKSNKNDKVEEIIWKSNK